MENTPFISGPFLLPILTEATIDSEQDVHLFQTEQSTLAGEGWWTSMDQVWLMGLGVSVVE